MITEPMKAPREPLLPEHFAMLQYPVFASYKEDGVRCLIHPELGPVSRTFKPIRNRHIRETLASWNVPNLDGELVLLNKHGHEQSFHASQSAVMSIEGEPNVQFRVFDSFRDPRRPFIFRWTEVKEACIVKNDYSLVTYIEQLKISSPEELTLFYEGASALGKEGIIVRSMHGPYKQGRVTLKERIMYKVVESLREEAVIVGWESLQTNCNVATADAFGRSKRSKLSSGLVTQPLLGAWLVESPRWGRFALSGFTAVQRECFWQDRELLKGSIVTFKYKPHGSKDAPRQPIFIGFRSSDDL